LSLSASPVVTVLKVLQAMISSRLEADESVFQQ
jgi:hypothetical protein